MTWQVGNIDRGLSEAHSVRRVLAVVSVQRCLPCSVLSVDVTRKPERNSCYMSSVFTTSQVIQRMFPSPI